MQKNIMAWILFIIKRTPATGSITVLFNAQNEKKREKGSATVIDFIMNVKKGVAILPCMQHLNTNIN